MLRIDHLTKTYAGDVRALDDVCMEIPKGMFGLLGPNGAGKSTLMRTIATLQQPDSGEISMGDVDVLRDPHSLRQRLGYLPQEFGAFPRTSPQVLLSHLATLKGIPKANVAGVVDGLLGRTNLLDVRNKSIDTFSGGMRQRFGIAQALIGEPEIVIVDEPTAGLDPAERRRFHNLLAEIGEDVVVILSTHIVEDVAELCPRMAILGQGRILHAGAPADLIAKLQGRLWRRVVARVEIDAIRQQHQVISTRLHAGELEARVLADAQPDDWDQAEPTLEDVYFATLLANGIGVEGV